MSNQILVDVRHNIGVEFNRFLSRDLSKLSEDALQNLARRFSHELVWKLEVFVEGLIYESADDTGRNYENEDINCEYWYYSGNPISLNDQLLALREAFPSIQFNPSFGSDYEKFHEGSEGNFVIPDWELFGKTYPDAVKYLYKKVFNANFNFDNYGAHKSSTELQMESGTSLFWHHVRLQGDVDKNTYILPAQLGKKYFGLSVRCVNDMIRKDSKGEFFLGLYEWLIILITNPILKKDEDLCKLIAGNYIIAVDDCSLEDTMFGTLKKTAFVHSEKGTSCSFTNDEVNEHFGVITGYLVTRL